MKTEDYICQDRRGTNAQTQRGVRPKQQGQQAVDCTSTDGGAPPNPCRTRRYSAGRYQHSKTHPPLLPPPAENHLESQLLRSLSRACRGKSIVFGIKWLREGGFRTCFSRLRDAPPTPLLLGLTTAIRSSVTPASRAHLPPREWPVRAMPSACTSGWLSSASTARCTAQAQAEQAPKAASVNAIRKTLFSFESDC